MPSVSRSFGNFDSGVAGVGAKRPADRAIALGDLSGAQDVGTETRQSFQSLTANGQNITAELELFFFGGSLDGILDETGLQPSLAQIQAGTNALDESVLSSSTTVDDLIQQLGLFGNANTFYHVWVAHDLDSNNVWYGTVTTGSGGS